MLRAHRITWVLTAALISAAGSVVPACSGTDGGDTEGTTVTASSSSGGTVCEAGDTMACTCDDMTMGAQTCNEDRTGFEPCNCGGGSVCGDGKKAETEECDDGNQTANDGCDPNCTIGTNTCGNNVPDPGECGEVGTCPKDCGKCGNMMEDPGECGVGGICPIDCDPCKDAITFVGVTALSGPVWTSGALTGIDGGNDLCKKIPGGADHICTHAELKKAELHVVNGMNELATLPAGTSIWLHREDTDMVSVNGVMTAGGAGARCNDWKYATNHISDGEYCDMEAAGKLACKYDNDPVFDQANPKIIPGQLDCGGQMRVIACCNEECKKP